MTSQEQALTDDKMRDEIAKVLAETSKINSGNRYFELVIGASATLAIAAIVKLFL